MVDDGFSMHSPETPEQEGKGQGFDPLPTTDDDMTEQEMFVMAKIFTSKQEVMLKLPMIPVFTMAYALAFMAASPTADGMVREQCLEGLAYLSYVLNDEISGADGVLRKALDSFARAWADSEE